MIHPHLTDEYYIKVVQYHNKWAVYDEWRGKVLSTSENFELANELAMMLARTEKRKYQLYSDAA